MNLEQSALIVVDIQNGFTPGGHLAVADSDQIIPLVNQLAQKFQHVVLTQDWHPADHISFAENVFYEVNDGKITHVLSVIDKAAIEAQIAE